MKQTSEDDPSRFSNGPAGQSPQRHRVWHRALIGRVGLGLLVGVLVTAALGGCGRGQGPNLVIISMDTTRADYLGAYGRAEARTPNIDALAEEGFVFRSHLTPVPITLPSHTSLMTGRYPPTHTVHDNGTFFVPQEEITLAEILKAEGYDTAAFVGAFPLDSQFGLDQGFDHYDDDYFGAAGGRDGQPDIYFDERPAGAVIDAAIAYHQERQGGPFFTFLHVFDPHQPQEPPAPYDVQFRNLPYDGEIAYVDEQLGRFFDFLKERGEWENTIVVLTADHGEGLGEHGELTHAILLHQATLRIPLILRGPGVPKGETDAWTVSTQVFATLLEWLGQPIPELDVPVSHSFGPLVENGGEVPAGYPRFTAFFETIAPRTSQGWSQLTAWMKEDWRLVHGPKPELYDLGEDPEELDDRHADEPQIADSLFTELRRFLDETETSSVADAVQEIDEATAERLEALGYLQSDAGGIESMSDLLDVEGQTNPRDRVVDVSIFSQAKTAMLRRQWPLAERLWLEVVRRSPDNTFAYQGLAQLYGMTEDWERALYYLDTALERRGDSTHLVRFKGEILIQIGRTQEGLDHLMALPADSVQAATWIGKAHQDLGANEEAKRWFRQGLEIDPKSRWLRLYLANLQAQEGDTTAAENLYKDIINDAPYFHLAFYNYGKMLMDQGHDGRARGLLERAALLAPQHEMTRTALGILAQRSSETGESAR